MGTDIIPKRSHFMGHQMPTQKGSFMSDQEKNTSTKCPECNKEMHYTGLPDIAGPVDFRFYRCSEHGVFRVYEDLDNEDQ